MPNPTEQAREIVAKWYGNDMILRGDVEMPKNLQELIDIFAGLLAASAAKEPDPWGVQHLPGLRDGSARVCINAKHGDSSDCGVCVVCQRDALTAKLQASELVLGKVIKYAGMLAVNSLHVGAVFDEWCWCREPGRNRKKFTESDLHDIACYGMHKALASPEARATGEGKAACYDCGLPYDDPGFCDLVVPPTIWEQISPNREHPEGGLLCPTCLCRALVKAGVQQTAGRFTSGPLAMPSAEDQA